MKSWKCLLLLLLCGPLLAACGDSKDAATIYVLTPPQKATRFTQDLATIVEQRGWTTNLGRSRPDFGYTYYVIEANGHWMHLWSTNLPMNGDEDPARCGRNKGGHPDPGQYFVTVDQGLVRLGLNHALAVIAPGRPRAFMSEISKELRASGYTVLSSPALCSPLSKMQGSRNR